MKHLKLFEEYHHLVKKDKFIYLKDLSEDYGLKFEYIDDMEADKREALFFIWRNGQKIETELTIKDLTFIQKTVDIDYIDPSYSKFTDRSYISDFIDERVEVIQYEGEYYLMDGYHRTIWSLFNDKDTVKAILYKEI